MKNDKYTCKLGTCSSIPKYKELRCLKIDFVLHDEETEKQVSNFLESCSKIYSGKIYKNVNNCIAVLSHNKGLHILEVDDVIVRMPDTSIWIYSDQEFNERFKFTKIKTKSKIKRKE